MNRATELTLNAFADALLTTTPSTVVFDIEQGGIPFQTEVLCPGTYLIMADIGFLAPTTADTFRFFFYDQAAIAAIGVPVELPAAVGAESRTTLSVIYTIPTPRIIEVRGSTDTNSLGYARYLYSGLRYVRFCS